MITYKNLNQLYFKALRITQKQFKTLNGLYKNEEKVRFLNSLKVITSWEASVKNESDYQTHNTEVLLPKLDQGSYLVLATLDKELSESTTYSYGELQISNLALVESITSEKSVFQVVDRNNGQPVANAKVHFKTETNRGYGQKLDKTLTTDQNGQVSTRQNYGFQFKNSSIFTWQFKHVDGFKLCFYQF